MADTKPQEDRTPPAEPTDEEKLKALAEWAAQDMADAADLAALKSARDAFEKQKGAWANGMAKGVKGLAASLPPVPT
jgi:hypothetical protein